MAQTFITTTANDYKQKLYSKPKIIYPPCFFDQKLPAGNWIVKETLDSKESQDAAREAVKKMYLRRYYTTYQKDYCKMDKRIDGEPTSKIADNVLLEYCYRLYSDEKPPILPPLSSSRAIFGFMHPNDYYGHISTYQDLHGRLAFKILEDNYAVAKVPYDTGSKIGVGLEKENIQLEQSKKNFLNENKRQNGDDTNLSFITIPLKYQKGHHKLLPICKCYKQSVSCIAVKSMNI